MGEVSEIRPLKVRAVWISDVHLGFRGCSAEILLNFLHSVECEYLYLAGKGLDGGGDTVDAGKVDVGYKKDAQRT